ncbi:DUF2752 domain-containing protein [Haloferula sp.]|uniref:DUF2752 domain-containing protein n=1 Tax=Haloferula sp. TaxID=2497595 RepID=UPI0032A0C5E7
MIQRLILILVFPALLVIGLILGNQNFAESGILPACMINKWTGAYCPGCGGTRAFQALARADILGALRLNPLGVIFIIGVALFLLRTSWEAAFPNKPWPRFTLSQGWWWALLVVTITFALTRNLPWWPFTLLAPH